jgi:hypothetical protein
LLVIVLGLVACLAGPATAVAPRSSIGKDLKPCRNGGSNSQTYGRGS